MPDIFTTKPKEETFKAEEASTPKAALSKHPIVSDENHIHSLSSFCTKSDNFSFHSQDPDEKIILFLRRHFITNIGWLSLTFIFSIIPFLLFIVGISVFEILNISLPLKFITAILILYYFIVFIYAFINFLNWFYNVTIITDRRIVDVDYTSLLYHNVAITKLSQIEDVNYTKAGFLRSIFNYGDVYAQTAGAASDHFDMLAIPQPEKIANYISDIIGEKHGHH